MLCYFRESYAPKCNSITLSTNLIPLPTVLTLINSITQSPKFSPSHILNLPLNPIESTTFVSSTTYIFFLPHIFQLNSGSHLSPGLVKQTLIYIPLLLGLVWYNPSSTLLPEENFQITFQIILSFLSKFFST